jgi:transcriptional regulator with XRE-family HTH domain
MKSNSMPQLFGENVRRLLLEAGWTHEALAKRCTKYKNRISRLEDGSTQVNLSMIFVLAQALNVDPATLIKPAPSSPRLDH